LTSAGSRCGQGLMQIMRINLKMKKNPTPDEKGMLNAYTHPSILPMKNPSSRFWQK
jgi:hypothetical protein